MDPLLHTRDEGTVITMYFIRWTSSEEGEDCEVDGHSFLGCTWYNSFDYPPKQTINGDYYAVLLDRFNNILKKKRPHPAKKKVLFHKDYARVHTCHGQIQRIALWIPHPAYLARCNYFLFPNLKKLFGRKRFTIREQLIAETEAYFEGLDKSYYSDGLKKLENRWIKCIELKGDYVEK